MSQPPLAPCFPVPEHVEPWADARLVRRLNLLESPTTAGPGRPFRPKTCGDARYAQQTINASS